jgi:endonuclease/exonuclease/phosphatase family metal-dependent hydrolase
MSLVIIVLLLIGSFLPLLSVQQTPKSRSEAQKVSSKESHGDNSLLFESGQAVKLRTAPTGAELRIVSYNMRWRSGEDLKKIIKLFREDAEIGNPAIVALQEVDRQKQRSGRTNTAKLLADELGLYYAWAAPPSAKAGAEEETGVVILSAYPLLDVQRIVLPHEGPDHRRRVALGASVKVGDVELRVYSAHAETRLSMDKKLDQLNALLDDLDQRKAAIPAIVMGDFNTWPSDAERKTIKLFSDAGFVTPFGSQSTFVRRVLFVPIELRLDWIWMRGLEAVSYGIDRKIEVSDHWPLWTNVRLQTKK